MTNHYHSTTIFEGYKQRHRITDNNIEHYKDDKGTVTLVTVDI